MRTHVSRLIPWISFILSIQLVLLTTAFGARSEEEYFHELAKVPTSYVVFGTVCEQMARLDLQEEFPSREYDIQVGIEYHDRSRTIGELDVIVFRKSDAEAIFVAEVKCWRDLNGARKKADDQLNRFRVQRERESEIEFRSHDGMTNYFDWTQFDEEISYEAISQAGGKAAGFDRVLRLDLEAIKRLHRRLVQCQENRNCPS